MEYRRQNMYNHMVWRAGSVVSPFYAILLGLTVGNDSFEIIVLLFYRKKICFRAVEVHKSNQCQFSPSAAC